MVWALQAVHIPDLYLQLYGGAGEGLTPEEVEAGIFQPSTQDEFLAMLEEMGISD